MPDSPTLPFDRVRFVLVEPTLAANIGAAARAIKTMGFAHLVVVNPRDANFRMDADAVARSTGAADVLAASTTTATLTEALQGVSYAIAMTGYDREFGPPLRDLRSVAALAAEQLAVAPSGDVAFVFGTERSGLENADILRCQVCCAIPANPGVCLAESRAVGAGGGVRMPAGPACQRCDPAGAAAIQR